MGSPPHRAAPRVFEHVETIGRGDVADLLRLSIGNEGGARPERGNPGKGGIAFETAGKIAKRGLEPATQRVGAGKRQGPKVRQVLVPQVQI
jgi:hypothetical protein